MRIIQSKYMFLLFPGILTLGQLWSDFLLANDLIIFQTYHVNVYDVLLIESFRVKFEVNFRAKLAVYSAYEKFAVWPGPFKRCKERFLICSETK